MGNGIDRIDMDPREIRTEFIQREGVEVNIPSKFRKEMRKIIKSAYEKVMALERVYFRELSFKEVRNMVLECIRDSELKKYNINKDAVKVITRIIKRLTVEIDSPKFILGTEAAITEAEDIMLGKKLKPVSKLASNLRAGGVKKVLSRLTKMRLIRQGKTGKDIVQIILTGVRTFIKVVPK